MPTLTKNRRIEARADEETAAIIQEAAELCNETISSFVVEAAREKAERLIGRADRTFMPAEMFDEMMAALNDANRPAQPVAAMVELFSRPSRITSVD